LQYKEKKIKCTLKNCVKSTRIRELLKAERLAKFAEVGKLFHTR